MLNDPPAATKMDKLPQKCTLRTHTHNATVTDNLLLVCGRKCMLNPLQLTRKSNALSSYSPGALSPPLKAHCLLKLERKRKALQQPQFVNESFL